MITAFFPLVNLFLSPPEANDDSVCARVNAKTTSLMYTVGIIFILSLYSFDTTKSVVNLMAAHGWIISQLEVGCHSSCTQSRAQKTRHHFVMVFNSLNF